MQKLLMKFIFYQSWKQDVLYIQQLSPQLLPAATTDNVGTMLPTARLQLS